MEKKPDHDCEFFLTTDVAVYSCECEHIEVSDKSISIEYVPLKKYQVLQSQNERLLSALKSVMGMWRIANAAHYGRNSDAVSKFTTLINEIEKQ